MMNPMIDADEEVKEKVPFRGGDVTPTFWMKGGEADPTWPLLPFPPPSFS